MISSSALPAAALWPFPDVIRSEDVGVDVTSASLAALHEVMFLMGGVLKGATFRRDCRRRSQLLLRGRGRARRRGQHTHEYAAGWACRGRTTEPVLGGVVGNKR